MAERLVKSLRGTGAIHAGEQLLRQTRYELSFWADESSATENASVVSRIDGHIDISGIAELLVLAGPDTLTLTIEDGRRLQIHLKSSGGAIAVLPSGERS